jgi:uncharacterized RDD family membrane protein YckC
MECPKCKRINPQDTPCCECGYAFTLEATSSPEANPPASRAFTAASMGRRLGAVLLDCLPVFIIAFLAEGVWLTVSGDPVDYPVTLALAGTLLWFVYMTVSQAATHNTLGKYLLGIQVVDYSSRSRPASVRQAVIRETIGRLVSSPLCMGYLTAFQESFNQAWSDRIANTVVVVRATDKRIQRRLIAGLLAGVALCPVEVVVVRQIHRAQQEKQWLADKRQEAAQGDASAMNNIGYLYEQGIGVQVDYAEAMKWYRRAADLGYGEAMYNIGMMFVRGLGRPVDYAAAMESFRKAAGRVGTGPMNDLYTARAMGRIGYLYEQGFSVPRDREQAISWYRKAVEAGSGEDDEANLKRLTGTP